MHTDSSDIQSSEILKRDAELAPHLEALGLESVVEYAEWCAQHGFSTQIEKHWRQRCKERYVAAQTTIQDRLARKKAEKRKPHRIITRIVDGDVDEGALTQPHLALIQQAVQGIRDQPTRDAFRTLLLAAEGRTGLLTAEPRGRQFGSREGNTYIGGLLALARHRSSWIRPLKTWRSRSHNVRRQFASLARHLFANYPVPQFMDSVWFLGQTGEAARRETWYKRLASGESPRRLDLPILLTKRMARYFLQSPSDYSADEALCCSQVIGLGGNERLARVVLGSRIATDFDNNDFWQTVIRWFIQHPMLDPRQMGPLIDYIHHRKFETRNAVPGDGTGVCTGCPVFTIKGRTPTSLIRQMREWHTGLRKSPERPQMSWATSGTAAFEWTEGALVSKNLRRWTIRELLSRKELHHEGQVMRHCVASYDNSCAFGGTSIWSLGVERNLGRRKQVLTIELANALKKICQVRGKANRLPSQKEMSIVRRWASREQLTLGQHERV